MKSPISNLIASLTQYLPVAICLALLFPPLLSAQQKEYQFINYSVADGMGQSTLYALALAQDYSELLYFGIGQGIDVLDGYAFKGLLTILPPWWQSTWIRLLLAGFVLGAFYLFYRSRTRALQARNLELEEKVTERTQQLQQRVEELQTINQVSKAAASELELHNLIRLIGEEMKKTFAAQIVYVAMLDKESRTINFPYQTGDQLPPLRLGEGLTSRILLSGEPLLINDDIPGAYRKYDLDAVGLIPQSYLGVPIPAGEDIIGVLSVQRTEKEQSFNEADQNLLSTLAANVGIAIHNARLYEDARQARAEADQANQAKSSFLSTVSHELRTPLTSIIGFTKITKKRMDARLLPLIPREDPKIARTVQQVSGNLDVVIAEGERLTNLINDVLDLAKIEAGRVDWRMEEINLIEIIQRAGSATNALFVQKKLPLNIVLPERLPVVTGDHDRLIQVIINLLSNAVKFTDEGSVTLKAHQKGSEVVISVADTGMGIADEDQTKVFEKFKQAGDTLTDKPQGTGLGLPICKEIVEYHGGKIWVESKTGQGSTFSFSVPLEAPSKAALQPIHLEELVRQLRHQIPPPSGEGALGNLVLVVDDEPAIRSLLNQELSEVGYRVNEAANGREALQSVRRERPDLIILDVMMPEMNGYDVAAVLKNDPKTMDIPIIILSILQDRERGMRIGIDRYLTKPIDTEKLFHEVDNLITLGKSPKKVMVVDENISTVKTLGDVLQTRGYHVVEANSREMMDKALESKPDIIILNALMGDKQQMVKSLRFEKGMENVLFLVYE